MAKMFDDLKNALQEMDEYLAGNSAGVKVHHVPTLEAMDVKEARKKLGLTQKDFARTFGISADTLKNWETGRRTPDGAARVLLQVIRHNPQAVLGALHS